MADSVAARRPSTAAVVARWCGAAAVSAASLAVVVVAGTRTAGYAQLVLAALGVGAIAARERRPVAVVALVTAVVVQGAAATFYTVGSDDYLSAVVFAAVVVFAAWLTGDSVRQRRRHAEAVRAQAVTAERLRIARELHDMIAHSIGVIAIQAGVGSRVLESRPAEARNALDIIAATSRQTLAELRQVLGGLRRADRPTGSDPRTPLEPPTALDPTPRLADVEGIAARARTSGVRVEVRWRGARRPLPTHVEESAFRIIQEALTNVLRHADARECRVTVDHGPDELAIEVVDDGRGCAVSDGGHGLTGMRERVDLLRGRFEAGPRPAGGFGVTARVPVPAGPA